MKFFMFSTPNPNGPKASPSSWMFDMMHRMADMVHGMADMAQEMADMAHGMTDIVH